MARKAKFTKAIQVLVDEPTRERLCGIAERHEVSIAEVIRDVLSGGLDDAEARWDGGLRPDTP